MSDFELTEITPRDYTIVRGDARSRRLADAIASVLGLELPAIPNTVVSGTAHDALWCGPDEWLVVSKIKMDPDMRQDDGAPLPLERSLRPLLAGEFATVVDVSSGYTSLHLMGARARGVLLKGCPLDLHPDVFTMGACARSHYFRAGILLRPIDAEAFELVVRRSFADYVSRMLLDAAGA